MTSRPRAFQSASNGSSDGKAFYRGFMLDSARCQESRAYYRKFIRFAAERGMNLLLWHFTDDQGCSLEFDSIPALASPDAYSKVEMRELIAFARGHGIEVVPELASLGHSRYLTRLPTYRHLMETEAHFTGMCPVSDETRQVIRRLIEETADVFDSPNFHVGLDEVNIGDHPLTKIALRKQSHADLLVDYIHFVNDVVTQTGRRMWMWGDSLLKHEEMLARVRRDIVICNWQYTPDASPATTQRLLNAGFDVVLCSALISHDQPLFPGDEFAVPNVRTLESQRSLAGRDVPVEDNPQRGHLLGHINTIWTPVRFVADSLWLGVDLAAGILCDGPDVDADARAQKLAENFYGLTGESASRFAEVAKLSFEQSPMRKQWLAVVRLEPLPPETAERVAEVAPRWMAAHATLRKLVPAVREHLTEFRAFMLLIEILAHTHDAAVRFADSQLPPAIAARIIRRGQSLLERVESAWDRERFADDPRKYKAPVASYQSDHLIPLLRDSLVLMENRRGLTAPPTTLKVAKPQRMASAT